MVSREPRNHHDVSKTIQGIIRTGKHFNPDRLDSDNDIEPSMSDEFQWMQPENDSDFEADSASPQRFNQQKLTDVIKDLNHSKESSE